MNREDLEREQTIELAQFDLDGAHDDLQKREAFDRIRSGVLARRPERVAEMEREKGLR